MQHTAFLLLAALLASSPAASAQDAPDRWSVPDDLPMATGYGTSMLAPDPDTLYVTTGSKTPWCYRYSVSSRTWTRVAAFPAPTGIFIGSASAWLPDAGLYVTAGDSGRTINCYHPERDEWDPQPAFPTQTSPGVALCAAINAVYAYAGIEIVNGQVLNRNFYELRPGSGWNRLADTPAAMDDGAALAYPGSGDYLFGLRGGATTDFWRYSMPTNEWLAMRPVPFPVSGETGTTTLIAGPAGTLFAYSAGGDSFARYDIARNEWTARAKLPALPRYGSAMAYLGDGDTIFMILGGQRRQFHRYSISADAFLPAPVPYGAQPEAAAVAIGNGDDIYLARGAADSSLQHFRISTNTWDFKASAPFAVGAGGALAYDGAGSIYATAGDHLTSVARYSIGSNQWTPANPLPEPPGAGGQLVVAGSSLYAMLGGGTAKVYRASLSGSSMGSWQPCAPAPGIFDGGTRASYPGRGDSIFVLVGGSGTMWSYSISLDAWNRRADGSTFDPADLPAMTGAASAMTCVSGRTLFVLPAGSDTDATSFWSYSIALDLWTSRATTPGLLQPGAFLVHPGRGTYVYAARGGGSPGFWRYRMEVQPPDAPTMAQSHADGVTPLAAGEVLYEPGVAFKLSSEDPDSWRLKIQVRVTRPGAAPIALESATVDPGTTVTLTLPTLPNGDYGWSARAVNEADAASAWTSFGSGIVAFTINYVAGNHFPAAPQDLRQFLFDGTTELAAGGRTTEFGIVLKAAGTDPDGDACTVQLEVQPAGIPFDGTVSAAGAVTQPIRIELRPGFYHWRVRSLDVHRYPSAWTSFSSAAGADFEVFDLGGSLGPASCASSAGGGWWLMTAHVAAAFFIATLLRVRRRSS